MAKTTIRSPGFTPTTQGDIFYAGSSGIWTRLGAGVANQALITGGAGANPSWSTLPASNRATYTANADITSQIPYDDSVPLITEGTQILSAALTCSRASSLVKIDVSGFGTADASVTMFTFSVFRDTTCIYGWAVTKGSTTATNISFGLFDLPGDTSAHTYTVRAGSDFSGAFALRFNGTIAARRFGGVAAVTLDLNERFV